MDPKENETPMESAEELEAEKTDLAEVKEDDLRQEIISEYGFDEENDKEKIDKAFTREKSQRERLTKAIGQKIKYRDGYTKLQGDPRLKGEAPPKTDAGKDKSDKPADFDKQLQEALDKRDLAEMEYPDDIKKAIKRVSELDGIPVKKAVNDPTVKARIDAWQKQKEAEEAAISRNNKSGGKTKFDPDSPPEFDLSSEKGRKEYDEWMERAIAHETANRGK